MLNGTRWVKRAGVLPLLSAAVAFVGLFWLLVQTRPERLRDLPPVEFPVACRNGCIVTLGRASNRLQGLPVAGGSSRTLAPHFGTAGTLRATFPTDLGLVIRSEEQEASPGFGARNPFQFWPPRQRARLWEVALDGQPARELLPGLRMTQAVASGEYCYWLSLGSASAVAGKDARPAGAFPLRTGELRVTPLHGGGFRRIAAGIPPFAHLEPLGRGVSWSVLRPGTLRGDRYLALPPDFQVHVVMDCSGTPEQLGDRVYWFDQRSASVPGAPSHPELKLESATVDGEQRRELLDLVDSPLWEARGRVLGVHQGKLYALLYRRSMKSGSPERPVLCEIRDDSVRELAPLRAGAGFTWLERGYLYYTVLEMRENWLDWSKQGLAAKRAQVLYRTRLPG